MQTLLQDLRYGARMLLRQPGFTLIVLLTLALGIGANTAIFSVVNAVMLRQLPFTDPDRLVRLYERNLERGWPDFGVSHPNFLDWRAQSRSFAGMGALTGASFNLNAGGEVEVIRGVRIKRSLSAWRSALPRDASFSAVGDKNLHHWGLWQLIAPRISVLPHP
jgi:hypothetical protein